MSVDDIFDTALRSPQPLSEVRAVAARYADEGYDSARLLGLFEGQRKRLRAAGREADEDVVTDVMDFIVGWCAPHMKVFKPAPASKN